MKYKWIFILLCSLSFSTNLVLAQIRKIPAAVTQAFKEKFPGADNVEWKDKLTSFEASFEMDEVKYQSTFSTKGEWKATEKSIDEDELPADVLEGFDLSKYKDWEIKSVSLIETADSQKFMLVVQKSALQKKRLYFSFDGQLIKDPISL